MAIDKKAYALANGYTDETVIGGGAIKGKNCTISKIEDIDGGHRITFGWTLDNGTTKSQTLDVKDGVDGYTPVKGVDYYDGEKGEPGNAGLDGKDGTTYTPSIGEVTTVESNIKASASVSVNTETKEAVFNFAIPRGKDGDRNADTVNGHTVKSDVPENAVFTDTVYDDTELNAKLNGKADKNAVLNSLEIVNGYTTAQIIPWSDGTHYRGFEDKSSNTYTDIITKDGVASVAKIENGVMTKLAEVATMDKLNFVPTTRLEGGFKVVAYSDRTITGNSKLECLENWVTNALSKYGDNLVIIGNIHNINYVDGFAIVNVWGDNTKGILGASGILVDQDGVYYYKTQNGVPGSGTLTKII